MRELKFRAFIHPDCGGGIPQECYNSMDYSDNHNGDLEDFFSLYKPYFFYVMQYTGLKDKKGVEIYEGDVVKVNGETEKYYDDNLFEPPETVQFELITQVFYNDSIASFDLQTIEPDLDMKSWGFYGEGTENHLEVIGNIYENPELL